MDQYKNFAFLVLLIFFFVLFDYAESFLLRRMATEGISHMSFFGVYRLSDIVEGL